MKILHPIPMQVNLKFRKYVCFIRNYLCNLNQDVTGILFRFSQASNFLFLSAFGGCSFRLILLSCCSTHH